MSLWIILVADVFVYVSEEKSLSKLTGNWCFSVVLTRPLVQIWSTSAFRSFQSLAVPHCSSLSQTHTHITLYEMTQCCYGVCVIIFANSHMSTTHVTVWSASGTMKIEALSLTFSHTVWESVCILILHYSPHIQVLMLLKCFTWRIQAVWLTNTLVLFQELPAF